MENATTARLALPIHQLRRALREPRRLRRVHYSAVLAGLRSVFEADDCRLVCDLFGVDAVRFRRLERDLLDDATFAAAIAARHRAVRDHDLHLFGATAAADHDRLLRLLYYCTRLQRPAVVVETGVFDGCSSAMILKALRDEGRGRLCSIDLPARTPVRASTDRMFFDALPAGHEPGWIVPDGLRDRWTLRLGTSRALLASWLDELGTIDVFVHDSLHTRANMTWEYETAWPHLAAGGLLVSDDVFWSGAFRAFARRAGGGRTWRGIGLVRKRDA